MASAASPLHAGVSCALCGWRELRWSRGGLRDEGRKPSGARGRLRNKDGAGTARRLRLGIPNPGVTPGMAGQRGEDGEKMRTPPLPDPQRWPLTDLPESRGRMMNAGRDACCAPGVSGLNVRRGRVALGYGMRCRNEDAETGSAANVWRQWRAKRVHCTPGLGAAATRERKPSLEWAPGTHRARCAGSSVADSR